MTAGHQIINEALEATGGDRDLAAAALGLARSTIDDKILSAPELKARWSKGSPNPPAQADTLHRPPADVPVPVMLNGDERSLVKNMIKEDSILADGLNKLGLTGDEAALAVQLAGFHQNCFVQSVQISGAGMTRIGIKLGTQIDDIAKRLTEVRKKMEEASGPITRAVFLDEEKYLLAAYVDMTDQIRRISDTAHRGMMLQAMIRYKLNSKKEKRLPSKPGFSTDIPV